MGKGEIRPSSGALLMGLVVASGWIGACSDLYGIANTPDDRDRDADGFSVSAGDCDDADAEVHPEATETYYDGVDQDCNGLSDYDADEDGYESDEYGGEDCNDTDPDIHPLAEEVQDDSVDSNCDGDDNT